MNNSGSELMALTRRTLPTVVDNWRSYWALHFWSVLACLHHHKVLENRPERLVRPYPDWTMAQLRGIAVENFFLVEKPKVKNFGLQYFMAIYLNHYHGRDARAMLLGQLRELIKLDLDWEQSSFHVCGESTLDKEARIGIDEVAYPDGMVTGDQVEKFFSRCDLFIRVPKLEAESTEDHPAVAIAGEVEGVRGSRLTKSSFWERKPKEAAFGIGISVDRGGFIGTQIEVFKDAEARRAVLTLYAGKSGVADDWYHAVEAMHALFTAGPKGIYSIASQDEGFDDIFNLVKGYFQTPFSDVDEILRGIAFDGLGASDGDYLLLGKTVEFPVPKLIKPSIQIHRSMSAWQKP